jgi:branched-chain amino acid transport system permease protein
MTATAAVAERRGARAAWLVAGAALAVSALTIVGPPRVLSTYGLSVAFLVVFYVALAEAWNLFSGYTGYVNFGYAGSIGLGSYTAAIAIWKFGLAWPLAVLLGGLFPAALSAVIAPALRARGAYFAIAMLGFAESTRLLVGSRYLQALTNAGVGIPLPPTIPLETQFRLMAGLMCLTILVTYLMAGSEFGLRLLAIREDELACRVLNINVTLDKTLALVLSTFLAGLAGALHAIYLSYIEPDTVFSANFTVQTMVMATFGGLGTVSGPVLGGILFTLVDQFVTAYLLTWHFVIFGLALVIVVLLLPEGIIPRLQLRLPRLRRRTV